MINEFERDCIAVLMYRDLEDILLKELVEELYS